MTLSREEQETIITFDETTADAIIFTYSKTWQQHLEKRLCLIRIFKEPDETPRPVIEIDREGETEYYVYDVLKCFDNVQQAHDYAEKHDVIDVEY